MFANNSFSQYAKNFNCNDCSGNKHNLFNELDSGYIIVLDWIMPCISCIGPSKTVYNVIQSYKDSFPGKIRMYICDDLADTYCPSVVSWADNNGMPNTIKFSDTSIKMEDYGLPGMPKIVIIANKSHYVYFNETDYEAADIPKLQNAFKDALSGKAIDNNIKKPLKNIYLTYNNNEKKHYLNFKINNPEIFNIEILNLAGEKLVKEKIFIENCKSQFEINSENLPKGIYILKVNNIETEKNLKLYINN